MSFRSALRNPGSTPARERDLTGVSTREEHVRKATVLGDYLRARRSVLLPEDVGLPRDGTRRVDGLRREEVAQLAGISPEYYLRLEQGHDHQPSEQVLTALAGALRLDVAGRAHLFQLAGSTSPRSPVEASRQHLLDHLAELIERWSDVLVVVTDRNLDIVQTNSIAGRLGASDTAVGTNLVRSIFDVPAELATPAVEELRRQVAGALRRSGDPDDPRMQEIVGDLSLRSADFRRIWARQDVVELIEGDCLLRVEPFGLLPFRWHSFAVAGFPGYAMITVSAPSGTTAAGALAYLAARGSAADQEDGRGRVHGARISEGAIRR